MLASSSPRRKELLEKTGHVFDVRQVDVRELTSGFPVNMVIENARRKAREAVKGEGELIIGADTIVVCRSEILGKPADIEDAKRMLELQSGTVTDIITGMVLIDTSRNIELYGHELSSVELHADTEAIEEYLHSGLWKGKAGGFGIQDRSGISIELAGGEFDNVVGMPMILFRRLLGSTGHHRP